MTAPFDPVSFRQRQLDAYKQRDLARFLAEYTEDVCGYRLPGGEAVAEGKRAFGEQYRRNRVCLPDFRAEWVRRLVLGHKASDQERVFGVSAQPMEVAAICEVTPAGIRRVWLLSAD